MPLFFNLHVFLLRVFHAVEHIACLYAYMYIHSFIQASIYSFRHLFIILFHVIQLFTSFIHSFIHSLINIPHSTRNRLETDSSSCAPNRATEKRAEGQEPAAVAPSLLEEAPAACAVCVLQCAVLPLLYCSVVLLCMNLLNWHCMLPHKASG